MSSDGQPTPNDTGLSAGLPDLSTMASVNVDNAVQANPGVQEPSLPMIGYRLSKFVLFIISGFIAVLLIFLFVKSFDASPDIQVPSGTAVSDSSYAQKLEVMKLLQTEKQHYRDFTVQIAQMILLNLLLPVLTAILGYIFASSKNKD